MEHCEFYVGESPVIIAAIHDGHHLRRELVPFLNVKEPMRMREEDPYTDFLAEASGSRIVVRKSRFEADLNRAREKAVYQVPADAWGLTVWKQPLLPEQIGESLVFYDTFYENLRRYLQGFVSRYGYFILLDVHTYNYRRHSPFREAAPAKNPEINIGTGSLPFAWRFFGDHLIATLSAQTINGHTPDVRENVNFRGGHFPGWINEHFGAWGCALAIEFKKTFMDEWTGRVNIHHLEGIRKALAASVNSLATKLAAERTPTHS